MIHELNEFKIEVIKGIDYDYVMEAVNHYKETENVKDVYLEAYKYTKYQKTQMIYSATIIYNNSKKQAKDYKTISSYVYHLGKLVFMNKEYENYLLQDYFIGTKLPLLCRYYKEDETTFTLKRFIELVNSHETSRIANIRGFGKSNLQKEIDFLKATNIIKEVDELGKEI